MERKAWWATDHGVTKNRTWLKWTERASEQGSFKEPIRNDEALHANSKKPWLSPKEQEKKDMWPETCESCPGSEPPTGNYGYRGIQSQPGPWQKKKEEGKGKVLNSLLFHCPRSSVSQSPKPPRSQRSRSSVQEISLDCAQWHSPRDQFAKAPSKTEKTKKTVGRSKHITTCTLILLMPGSTVTSIISKPRVRSQHDLGYSLLKSKIWRKALSCKKGTVKFC